MQPVFHVAESADSELVNSCLGHKHQQVHILDESLAIIVANPNMLFVESNRKYSAVAQWQ